MQWFIWGLLAVGVVYLAVTFNRLVSLNKRADGAWSDIDVQLKRRWDLIPALVETVSGYARHESETLQRVVAARSGATQAASLKDRGRNELDLSSAVSRLFAVAEAYPDLKANQNFQNLQQNLVDVENQIQHARRYYNAVIRDYNTLIQGFPSVLAAKVTGFGERAFFQIDAEERSTPQVDLGSSSSGSARRAESKELDR